MLKIKDVEFSYDEQKHPYLFNLEVRVKEIALISGVSGAGKSTLLDLIAGFLKVKSGFISVDNYDITNLRVQNRPVSILLQSDNLFDHLSVKANLALAFNAKTKTLEADEKITNALLEVGLKDFANRKAASLSGGQKQRVALARTLLLNRKIILLDEPFTALDEDAANVMQSLLKKLVKKYNWHAIIVSHNLADIKKLNASHYILENYRLKKQL